MSEISILALIPAWNEGMRLGPIAAAARGYLPVLVVDDGSHDDTSAVAQAAGAEVVRHPQNRGKGAALTTGFTWALERGYETVITLDADGQHDPADIPKFLSSYEDTGADLLIGRRDFSLAPWPRWWSNPIGDRLLSWALGVPIYDNQNGYRLYSRALLEGLDLITTGFEWEVEVIVHAICRGMHIGWVEIRTIYDTGKASYFHPLKDTARFLGMVWYAWRQRSRPGSRLTLDV